MGFNFDDWVNKLLGFVSKQISIFVAFLFFIFTLGAVYGWFLISIGTQYVEYLIILPAVMGIIAYYNRIFAIAVFVIVLAFLIL